MFAKEAIKLAKPYVEAIKKINKGKWEWKPEVGESAILDNKVVLVTSNYSKGYPYVYITEYEVWIEYKKLTPLLHWERIEEMLEGMGYWLKISKPLNKYIKKGVMKVGCSIYLEPRLLQEGIRNNYIVFEKAKSRQLAVMQAVIELGKKK